MKNRKLSAFLNAPLEAANRFPLLRRFSIISLVAMLVTAAILVFLYRQDQLSEHEEVAAQNNEETAIHLMLLLNDQINTLITTSNVFDTQALRTNPNIDLFTAALEKVREHDMLKLKIYNLSGTAIYSSARDEIGATSKHPDQFNKALSGEVMHRLDFRDTFFGATGELHDVYISATYMPLAHAGKRIGVIEVYKDANPFFKRLHATLFQIFLMVLGIFAVLYAALFLFLLRADRATAEWQKAIVDSEERFRKITESAQDAIIMMGADQRISFWNIAAERIFGYTAAEAIGQDMHALITPTPARAGFAQAYPHFQETGEGPIIGKVRELTALRKGGEEFSAELSVSATQFGGQWHAIGIVRDITGRVQAEAKILATQAELQRLLNAAKQSHRATLSVVEDQRRAEESLRQLNEELENKVQTRTSDLEQSRHDAEQANRSKSAFLAAMSHEIRTPMNGVIGMIDVLQQSSLNGSQMETTNIIHDSAFALLTIIDDILDFSKIEAGKLQIDYAPMNISGVVEGTCETLIPLALKKGVELMLFTDPDIPASVMGDPGRLRQILVNLTNNAIKFSSGQDRQGKVSVRAVLVESTPEQATLDFRVTDNGIGIDEATQALLFTPFIQADTSTTRNFGGTGLGLVIARQLTNIMGGEITMHSELGKGSMFSVRLPFKLLVDVDRVSTRQVGLKPDLQNPDLIAGLPCMVVGDSESLADDLAAYLVHDGAAVERVADMVAAQQWITRRPPGLCIVVIDTEGVNSSLDGLRAAARTQQNVDARFVVIGRGGRRQCRVVAADHVALDAEVMHRRTFLEAVAIAAGRAKPPDRENLPGEVKATLTPLSREEARRQGSLILIAEDNEINQKVLLQQLRLLGRTADIASDGREALERWRSGDYGLLFTDLHMPEMDGYELTAAIRAAEEISKPRIPIIAITANALKGEADHCRAIGMDDYLSKPVQLVNLKAMLEKWMPVVSSDPIADEATSASDSQSLPPHRGKARMGVKRVEKQRESNISTPSLTLPLQGGGNAVVDVNILKALVGDDEAMIREFLHDFRLSAAKIAAELRAACAAGEAAAAGALAHKLKSSARSVGALALGELCAAMEQAGKCGDAGALAVLLPQFEQELAGVEGFLERY